MVHQCYSIETYRKAYEQIVFPCKDASEWQKMYGREVLPPKIKTKKAGGERIEGNNLNRTRVGQGGKLVEVELLCIAVIVDLQDKT